MLINNNKFVNSQLLIKSQLKYKVGSTDKNKGNISLTKKGDGKHYLCSSEAVHLKSKHSFIPVVIQPPTKSDKEVPKKSASIVNVEVRKTMSLEEELQDIVSVDFMADLFEKAPSKSLNDRLSGNIQIGLNDRIAFVKNLFNGNQEDYNRVISQLNTLKSGDEAKNFIDSMVKPDYNWSEKEELETRFMEIIERKFA
jgi:hypothetical protein